MADVLAVLPRLSLNPSERAPSSIWAKSSSISLSGGLTSIRKCFPHLSLRSLEVTPERKTPSQLQPTPFLRDRPLAPLRQTAEVAVPAGTRSLRARMSSDPLRIRALALPSVSQALLWRPGDVSPSPSQPLTSCSTSLQLQYLLGASNPSEPWNMQALPTVPKVHGLEASRSPKLLGVRASGASSTGWQMSVAHLRGQ